MQFLVDTVLRVQTDELESNSLKFKERGTNKDEI